MIFTIHVYILQRSLFVQVLLCHVLGESIQLRSVEYEPRFAQSGSLKVVPTTRPDIPFMDKELLWRLSPLAGKNS